MPRPDLRTRDVEARELMDDPHADRASLERTYLRFGPLNAVLSGWRRLYRRTIRPRAGQSIRIRDIGSGGGDVARTLARCARRDGLQAEVLALDADPRATRWAQGRGSPPGVSYVTGLSADLAAAGEGFDVIASNHLLHHLDADELRGVLAAPERMLRPGGIAVHADIARSSAAYTAYDVLTRVLAPLLIGSFIRADGLTSIRRSYTADELRTEVPAGWWVETAFPHRLLLLRCA